MDPSVLLILSNLLHLQSHLDPTATATATATTSTSSTATATTSSPLLFFAIASILSYAVSSLDPNPHPSPSNSNSNSRSRSRSRSRSPPPPPPRSLRPSSSNFFLSLSSDRIFSMDPSARDAKWRSLYGLSYPVFATLLDHLRPHLSAAVPLLPPDHSLSLALSRLSLGLSSRSLSRHLSLPPPLISRCTHSLTRLLSTRLYPDFVKPPSSSHRLLQTTSSFKDLTSLPNLAGFLSSSPVRLSSSHHNDNTNPLLLSPHRPFPSLLLQAVSDHRKIFWDACVRHPGSSHPADHFRDSSLSRRLSHSLILRDPLLPLGNNNLHLRPYLAAPDNAFPLLPFLLTPFPRPSSPPQDAFNAALAKGRAASVDAALALLKGRWKILRNLNVGLDHAAQTVVACVVLHNMCQIAGEPEDEGKYLWRDPPETPQAARPVEERSMCHLAESLRQALADDLYERQQRLTAGGSSTMGVSR